MPRRTATCATATATQVMEVGSRKAVRRAPSPILARTTAPAPLASVCTEHARARAHLPVAPPGMAVTPLTDQPARSISARPNLPTSVRLASATTSARRTASIDAWGSTPAEASARVTVPMSRARRATNVRIVSPPARWFASACRPWARASLQCRDDRRQERLLPHDPARRVLRATHLPRRQRVGTLPGIHGGGRPRSQLRRRQLRRRRWRSDARGVRRHHRRRRGGLRSHSRDTMSDDLVRQCSGIERVTQPSFGAGRHVR